MASRPVGPFYIHNLLHVDGHAGGCFSVCISVCHRLTCWMKPCFRGAQECEHRRNNGGNAFEGLRVGVQVKGSHWGDWRRNGAGLVLESWPGEGPPPPGLGVCPAEAFQSGCAGCVWISRTRGCESTHTPALGRTPTPPAAPQTSSEWGTSHLLLPNPGFPPPHLSHTRDV